MKYVIFGFLLIQSICFFSQKGPAGIGNTNGNSSLKIWLRAEDINADNSTNNPSNGTTIESWADFSGYGNDLTQNNTANRPSYNTTGSFDAVTFNANLLEPQFMIITNIQGIYRDASVFFVLNPEKNGKSNALFNHPISSLRVAQWEDTDVIGYTQYEERDYTSSIASPFESNSIISFHKNNNSTSLQVRSNSNTENINIEFSSRGIPIATLGRASVGADEASGDFYEIIFFDDRVNNAQRIIIENYLSAKYSSIAIPVKIYNEDSESAGNYDFDVAGIGKIQNTNQQLDSQGTGIIRVLNAEDLDNNEFFMWGHDNGALTFTENINAPSSVISRLERTWRVSETNRNGSPVDVGAVELRFDLNGLANLSERNICLLVDTDNDGDFNDETPIKNPINLGSGIYSFTSVTAIGDNCRFTLGQAPLTIITNRRITNRVNK